jgi:hypothetical protein
MDFVDQKQKKTSLDLPFALRRLKSGKGEMRTNEREELRNAHGLSETIAVCTVEVGPKKVGRPSYNLAKLTQVNVATKSDSSWPKARSEHN